MRKLRGEKVEDPAAKPAKAAESQAPAPVPAGHGTRERGLEIIRPWERVARDGRDFAQEGAGTMYWFKVPLGGLSYPKGFRLFLQPALENERIGKIRFVLDSTNEVVMDVSNRLVPPFAQQRCRPAGPRRRPTGVRRSLRRVHPVLQAVR